jgi:uncharacterized membrane protein YeiB
MMTRPYASKPTLALWMLVAVADAAVLVTTDGLLTVLVILAGLAIVAGTVACLWLLHRRTTTAAPARPAAMVGRQPAAVSRRRA